MSCLTESEQPRTVAKKMTPDHFPKRPVAGRLGGALAALLLPALPAMAQTLVNPSFEDNNFTGTVTDNDAIPGWTTTTPSLVGLNAHADNGTIPDGANVAFMSAGGILKTTISGLTPGTRYNVTLRVNASAESGAQPYLRFSTNASVDPLDTINAKFVPIAPFGISDYRTAAYEFTATAASHEITISNPRTSGTHILLVDALAIAPTLNAWSVAPWTGDADSGINSSYAYTHALNFNFTGGLTVNGVPFMGGTTAIMETAVAGRLNVGPLGGSTTLSGANLPQLTGNSIDLARNLRGGALVFSMVNLKPDTQYVASFYTVGMDDPGSADEYRSATFYNSECPQALTVDQNRYGKTKGIIISHTYTSSSSGTATITMANTGTAPRLGAFANREAASFSGTSGWTSAQWTDDASSGINSTYHYTHAYKFNSASSPVVNGVTFKGLTGDNPADGSVFSSSRLTGSATNPAPNISGTSASLATTYHGSIATGSPTSYILTDLTPGKEYICTLYSVGGADTRKIAFFGTAGGKPAVIDQQLYGSGNGIRMEYRYVAPPSGTMVMSSSAYDSTKLFQVYALSNREAQVTAGPGISSAPASATIPAGTDYTLQVGATGTAPLSYQWYFNNTPIPGATTASYTLVSPDYDDTGDYKVKVTNPGGNVTTEPATITVANAVPGLFNTGVNWDGQLLADGVDPHYSLVGNPDGGSPNAFVETTGRPAAWMENDLASQWIGPRSNATGAASGETLTYTYRTSFTLTNFDPDSVVITGRWGGDDVQIGIYLNGIYLGSSGITWGYAALLPFRIDAGTLSAHGTAFRVDGTPNTLDFVVRNENSAAPVTGTATGFIVRDIQGTGSLSTLTAPEVITDPVSTTATIGQTVTLGVVAGGSAPLAYQWQKDGVNIPGATHTYLTIPVTGTDKAGAYRVVVTNGFDSDTSAAATLTVLTAGTPPSNFTLTMSGGSVTGSFHGTPGVSYTVERSSTLLPGSWVTVQTTVAPASGIVPVNDPSAPVGRAFYHIVYTP